MCTMENWLNFNQITKEDIMHIMLIILQMKFPQQC